MLYKQSGISYLLLVICIFILQVNQAVAAGAAITAINFSSLAGSKVQIKLSLNQAALQPKLFQTDNPARIALDLVGVSSQLKKKRYEVNQGAVGSVYVIEANSRTRVVVNLTETVPYETRIQGSDVFLILKPISIVKQIKVPAQVEADKRISNLLPKQTISNIDFRRGKKGEGRLILALTTSNTVVDVQERGGKVILKFLNTQLPAELEKRFDVADFATPVQMIDAQSRGSSTNITITPIDGNYDYSSYQSEGLFIVDFLALSPEEKAIKMKQKFAYSGDKLSLNFQEIEVRAVLQILADFTELNIIAADSVTGNVSLRLNDVPWDQALDLILKSKGLGKRQTGNVVMVAPIAEITKIEQDELDAQKVTAQLEPLKTEYIHIQFAKAEDMQALISGQNIVKSSQTGVNSSVNGVRNSQRDSERSREERDGLLSSRGAVTVDSRTNTLIVRETVKQLAEIREMIQLLDVPIRQVMVESRIVIADTSFARNLGVKFGVAKAAEIGSDKVFGMGAGQGQTFGNVVPNANGGIVSLPDGAGHLVDLAAAGIKNHPVGALGMTLARAADYVLNLELTALENEGGGEVLANPRVMTVDRKEAFIKQGVAIPYETVSQEGTSTELIDAVLELKVTPQITPSGEVMMELEITKNSPDTGTGGIDKREVKTTVQVKDGETLVLGGIYEQTNGKNNFKIPFFGDLPGIGFLFRKKEVNEDKRELLIFITPKIVKDSLSVR